MSFQKPTNKAMEFEPTRVSTKPSKIAVKKAVKSTKRQKAESLSGAYLTWHLTTRYARFIYKHRVGLLILSNIAFVAYLYARHTGKI